MISISGVGTTARSPKAGHSALDAGSERRPIFESRKNQRLPLRSLRCDVNILLAKSFYHFALLHRFGQSASEPSEVESFVHVIEPCDQCYRVLYRWIVTQTRKP
ncbi:hypothetical protein ACFX13_020880 [Malus domestica]